MTLPAKVRVGIIGTGGIARSVHIPAYKKLGDRVEVVSAFDIAGERLAAVADEANILYRFTDIQQLLQGPELDAVSICTPPSSHAEFSEAAFRAGLHVLCEKPISNDVPGTRRVLDAARASGKKLMVGFQNRFTWQTVALKAMISAGELGSIYYTRALATRRRGIPGWGVFTSKALSGGGPLMDIGSHALDQAMYLIGNPTPVSVLGMTYLKLANQPGPNSFGPYQPDKMETEDFGVGLVRFADGSSLLIEASWALNIEKNVHNIQVAGTKGGADCYPLKLNGAAHGVLYETTVQEPRRPENGQDAKVAHFIDCIQHNLEPLVTPSEILNVATILSAIYESAETGQAVTL